MAIHRIPNPSTLIPSNIATGVGAGGYVNTISASNISQNVDTIKGDMLQASLKRDDFLMNGAPNTPDDIKERLCSMLVAEMMNSKHIMFTKLSDPAEGTTTYHARTFVCPDDMTRVLRQWQKNNR